MNNVDCETAYKVPLYERSPFLEMEALGGDGREFKERVNDMAINNPELAEQIVLKHQVFSKSIDFTAKMASPRVIKSHLPLEMLPPNLLDTCKVIFVGRNPKDCCVSYFHHTNLIPYYKFKGDFEDFSDLFLRDELEFGSYWHILKVCTCSQILISSLINPAYQTSAEPLLINNEITHAAAIVDAIVEYIVYSLWIHCRFCLSCSFVRVHC